MGSRRRRRSEELLRLAIDCLPLQTREAMLDGTRREPHHRGRLHRPQRRRLPDARRAPQRRPHERCQLRARVGPLHRRRPAARPATDRELRTLRAMLEASIARGRRSRPARGVSEREGRRAAASARPTRAPRDTGERDRSAELRKRHGWAWLRIFRRYDTYEARSTVSASASAGRSRPPPRPRRAGQWTVSRPDELDLRHDARGRGVEQEAHRLGDVLGLDHRPPADLLLDPVGHRRVDEARAERGHLDAVAGELAVCTPAISADDRAPWSPSRRPASARRPCRRSKRC